MRRVEIRAVLAHLRHVQGEAARMASVTVCWTSCCVWPGLVQTVESSGAVLDLDEGAACVAHAPERREFLAGLEGPTGAAARVES